RHRDGRRLDPCRHAAGTRRGGSHSRSPICRVKRPAVFTIAASAAFAETLAKGLIARIGDDPLTLSSAVIYLPTRRAARNFGDAFARVLGGAALLPQFKPLGDSEEDELLLADDALELAPAIRPLRRQMLLARLIRLMDEVETQDCDLSRWKELAPADLAEHWQGVSHFLGVLQQEWPAIMEAEQAMNPAARRVQALRALANRLQAAPPSGMVI